MCIASIRQIRLHKLILMFCLLLHAVSRADGRTEVKHYLHCLHAEQDLCHGRVSVRPSVCPAIRPQQLSVAGLLLSAVQQEISIYSGGRHMSNFHQMFYACFLWPRVGFLWRRSDTLYTSGLRMTSDNRPF